MKRFTVRTDGELITLFTVREIRNKATDNQYDLNIHFPGKKKVRFAKESIQELIIPQRNDSFKGYIDQHISIHCSPESEENNVIKRTILMEEGNKPFYHTTSGIKKDNLFVPIIFRVCGDFQDESYIFNKGKYSQIDIPFDYNPLSDQLRYMLVVSSRGLSFQHDIEHPSNVFTEVFNNFYLTIIYSIFNKPSLKHTINMFLSTEKGNRLRGLDWWEIYNLYTDMNGNYIKEYFKMNDSN